MPARIADIEQLAAAQLAVSRCAKGPVEPRCALERAVRSPRSRAREGSAWFFPRPKLPYWSPETLGSTQPAASLKIATRPLPPSARFRDFQKAVTNDCESCYDTMPESCYASRDQSLELPNPVDVDRSVTAQGWVAVRTPRHAHAMHAPCVHHAHATHMPCTRQAHAMHAPYTPSRRMRQVHQSRTICAWRWRPRANRSTSLRL